jgi:hypothetical protein
MKYTDRQSEVPPLTAEMELYYMQDPFVREFEEMVKLLQATIARTKEHPQFRDLPCWPAIDRAFRCTLRLKRFLQGIQLQLGLCGREQVYRGRLKFNEKQVQEGLEAFQALMLTFIPQKRDYPEYQPVIEPIKVGDRVRQRSSLRVMIVQQITGDTAHCMWRNRWGDPNHESFPVGLLVKAEAFAGRRDT